MASTTLWDKLKGVLLRYLDVVPRLVDHLIDATKEPDHATPSSARIYGGIIFSVALFLQVMIVSVLCWKVLMLDLSAASPDLTSMLQVMVRGLLAFLLWSILFDVGAALSLYGINVWRWIAAIRTGRMPSSESDTKPAVLPVKPAVTPVKPATSGAEVADVVPDEKVG